jgi:hypothetical protein
MKICAAIPDFAHAARLRAETQPQLAAILPQF